MLLLIHHHDHSATITATITAATTTTTTTTPNPNATRPTICNYIAASAMDAATTAFLNLKHAKSDTIVEQSLMIMWTGRYQ